MPGSVKAVLFDAVGTLIDPRPSVAEAYHTAGQRYGTRLSLAEVQSNVGQAIRQYAAEDDVRHDHRTSEEREKHRWQTIIQAVFPDLADDVEIQSRLFDDLWEHFAAPANWVLFDDVADTWQRLREFRSANGPLILGIASNFDRRLLSIGQALAPINDCQHWFVSSLMGHRKPGREFFAMIEQQLGLSGEELLLVGDDVENDYDAACAAGWRAYLIDRSKPAASLAATNNDCPTLGNLGELLEVLAR